MILRSIKFGLLVGAIIAFLQLIMYLIDVELMANWLIGIVMFLIMIIAPIVSAVRNKKWGGGITFVDALLSCVITGISVFLVNSIFSFILFNVIDTELSAVLTEVSQENMLEWLESSGVPQEEIDNQLDRIEEQFESQTTPRGILMGLVFVSIMTAIIGIIVGLVIKSKPQASSQNLDNI